MLLAALSSWRRSRRQRDVMGTWLTIATGDDPESARPILVSRNQAVVRATLQMLTELYGAELLREQIDRVEHEGELYPAR